MTMAEGSTETPWAPPTGTPPPEGWFPDPWQEGSVRWWDGRRWTGKVAATSVRAGPASLGPQGDRTSADQPCQAIKFRETLKGYKREAVDKHFGIIATELDAGRLPVNAVTNVTFPEALKGYHRDDVDQFLRQLAESWRSSTDTPSADLLAREWHAFNSGQLNGSTTTAIPAAVPPQPSLRRTLKAVAIVIVVLGLVGYGIGAFISDQLANAALVRNGVVIQARVVAHSHVDDGDSGSYDYLDVLIPACQCRVQLPTTNLGGHPVGSFIGVRYDPKNPENARPMVDNNDVWLQDAFYLGLYGLMIWLFIKWAVPTNKAWRERRKAAVS